MLQLELLKKVVMSLNYHKIGYMITGSIVSSIQGEPRSTHDIDIILNIKNNNDINLLLSDFKPPDFYLDEQSINEALKDKSMFNLIDTNNGEKVDFWLLTESEFDKSRFLRKVIIQIDDLEINVSSPEDTILAKLNWCKLSNGSKKHFMDALRIFEIQSEKLDLNYIEEWSKKIDVTDLWENIKSYN